MNCSWKEKISLLIDGELPATDVREVERHLVTCSECQQVRTDFLIFRSQLASYVPTLKPLSDEAVLAKILGSNDRVTAIPRATRRFAPGFNFNLRVAAFAALSILALLIGVIAYRNLRQAGPPKQQAVLSVPVQSPTTVMPEQKSGAPQTAVALNNSQSKPREATIRPSLPRAQRQVIQRAAFEGNPPVRNPPPTAAISPSTPVRSADAETLTAIHFENAELLLRSFRNVRLTESGTTAEVSYEKRRAQQLVYQNMMLRREADSTGDVQVAALLENLEPILIDIANLPDQPADEDIRLIKDRVERKNIVALLQVNSTAMARAFD